MRFVSLMLFTVIPLVSCTYENWRTADRSSVGIAPAPEQEDQALVYIFAARAVKWRGHFAVHSWISTKSENQGYYTNYHVMGWRLRHSNTSVVVNNDIPDRKWFGSEPDLIYALKGPAAERAIVKIQKLAESYPYRDAYRAWPGPNSNTFISYIIRNTSELGVELPPHAIGKDWINDGDFVGMSESGTGVQLSIFGILGLTIGLAEGVEVNLLGLNFGLDFWRPALKLPFLGRIGFQDAPVFPPDSEES